jgi:hypothetical protein
LFTQMRTLRSVGRVFANPASAIRAGLPQL